MSKKESNKKTVRLNAAELKHLAETNLTFSEYVHKLFTDRINQERALHIATFIQEIITMLAASTIIIAGAYNWIQGLSPVATLILGAGLFIFAILNTINKLQKYSQRFSNK